MNQNKKKEKILVLRYRFIGDTILTVPFLRNLRRGRPDAVIHLVLAPVSGDVLKGIPYVDRILFWDPDTIHADCLGTHKSLKDKWQFIKELRDIGYSKVYILKRSFSSAIMGCLTGAQKRIGFDTEMRGFLLTNRVSYKSGLHEVQNFLNCLRVDGISIEDDYLEVWIDRNERDEAAGFLKGQGCNPGEPFIAIHPFSAVLERGWPLERFIELANSLYRERGCPILWLGGRGDKVWEDRISAGYKGRIIMAIGRTDIRQTMALLSFCTLFVGNDSGIMHIAAALKVPLVAIFGPQSVEKFGPWAERGKYRIVTKRFPCHPCKQRFFEECKSGPEGRPFCLESIGLEEVLEACGTF